MIRSARVAVVVCVLVLSGGLSACGVGQVEPARDRAISAWAEVQAQYARRAALVPEIVSTVEGVKTLPPAALTELAQNGQRAAALPTTPTPPADPATLRIFVETQARLSGSLDYVMTTLEADPPIRANPTFVRLRLRQQAAEARLAIARRDYEEAARASNDAQDRFPVGLWTSTPPLPSLQSVQP